ncbi:hypothetical protein Metbo_1618 [Methanobacterium lacus]|uniref:Uncharacterized protein n=1 Tax=Methanobacterium lacus (strain AL-21) TaxID=877455 RepID=F0T994_METLA|nr:hypothetical protein [Methanobacterium lacus]ADZ09845.1 hypothetical protein Metbo_1618 [Methanobacterium lacus]
MKKYRLEITIVILSVIIFISIFGEVNPLIKQDLDDKIVEYNTPLVEQAINGSAVYITGVVRDDSKENFDDVLLNVYGIGSQGQRIDSKIIKIDRIESDSNVNYNVTLENSSAVVAGDVKVLNATEIS